MPFNRYLIDGYLLGGAERFSVGLAFAGASGDAVSDPADLTTVCNAIMTQVVGSAGSWGPTLRSQLSVNGGIDRVRGYYYATPNSPAGAAGVSSAAVSAGSGAMTLPPQCALVFSLLTDTPGRRTRGRIYWPMATGTLANTGKITGPTSPANLALAVKGMLEGIASIVSTPSDYLPVVVSQAGSLVTPVTRISVGDVIDTQRRRRDALVEVRSYQPIVP